MSFIELLKKNNTNGKDIDADKAFIRSIAISFFAIAILIVIFSTSTFAWYRESVETTETIQASVYILDISLQPSGDGEADMVGVKDADGSTVYTLSEGVDYSLKALAVADDRTNAETGYIKILIDGKEYYSEQIDRGEQIEFKLCFNSETEIRIIERWGTSRVPHTERDLTDGGSYLDLTK